MNLTINTIGGQCPVQAEGSLNGKYFYFRARGEHWRFEVGEGAKEEGEPLWTYGETYKDGGEYEAGWMDQDEAREFIDQAATKFLEWEAEQEREEAQARADAQWNAALECVEERIERVLEQQNVASTPLAKEIRKAIRGPLTWLNEYDPKCPANPQT